MHVFNAATKTIVVRSFAAGTFTPKLESVLINPGREVEVLGPILSEYGLRTPYKMQGNVLVRDWAQPWISWVEEKISAVVALKDGEASMHKQSFMKPNQFEGFKIAFCEDRQLILF